MMNCWKILDISPTSDVKEIKKAYARMAKKFHPEDNPEGFKRLHSAYKSALNIANGKNEYIHYEFISENENNDDFNDNITDAEVQCEFDFETAMLEYDEKANKELEKLVDDILNKELGFIYGSFITSVIFRNRCWGNFFLHENVSKIAHNPVFINKLCEYIKARRPRIKFLEYIYYYYQFCDLENAEDRGVYSELFDLAEYGVNKMKRINKIKNFFSLKKFRK